ncbi:hypothetical protein AC249_AIPGENE22685 [Exaiptasia diaphana]|nr:hypothetical protein AC249_AIPGENE22685 [Exaiptasia diaphana]
MDDTWQNFIIVWRNSDGLLRLFKNGGNKESEKASEAHIAPVTITSSIKAISSQLPSSNATMISTLVPTAALSSTSTTSRIEATSSQLPSSTGTITSTLVPTAALSSSTSTTSRIEATSSQLPSSTATTTNTPTTEQAASSSTSTAGSSITPTTPPTSDCQIDFPRQLITDYVEIPSALAQEVTSFTLSFWLKPSSSYKDTLQIFSYYDNKRDTDMSLAIKEDGVAEINVAGGGAIRFGQLTDLVNLI